MTVRNVMDDLTYGPAAGRYGVASCLSSSPMTAMRKSAGASAMARIQVARVSDVGAALKEKVPTG